MRRSIQRVLLTGAGGFIGSHIHTRLAACRSIDLITSHDDSPIGRSFDLETSGAIHLAVKNCAPDLVIHTAAVTSIAQCETDPATALRVNTAATEEIATALQATGGRLILFSTDQVFDGENAPYDSQAATSPLHTYGRSKTQAEQAAAILNEHAVVLRPSLVLGKSPQGSRTPEELLLLAHATGQPLPLFHDEIRSPIQVSDVVNVTLALCRTWRSGVLHIGGPSNLSRFDLGLALCKRLQLPPSTTITRSSRSTLAHPERRPRDLSLISEDTWNYLGQLPIAP